MMESTYRMVSSSGWAYYLFGAAYFGCMAFFLRSAGSRRMFFMFAIDRDGVRQTAKNCRQTGYISAVLTRYTALITLNILIFNFLFNVARYAAEEMGMMGDLSRPLLILYAVCASCILAILTLIVSIFVICSEVIKQIEGAE